VDGRTVQGTEGRREGGRAEGSGGQEGAGETEGERRAEEGQRGGGGAEGRKGGRKDGRGRRRAEGGGRDGRTDGRTDGGGAETWNSLVTSSRSASTARRPVVSSPTPMTPTTAPPRLRRGVTPSDTCAAPPTLVRRGSSSRPGASRPSRAAERVAATRGRCSAATKACDGGGRVGGAGGGQHATAADWGGEDSGSANRFPFDARVVPRRGGYEGLRFWGGVGGCKGGEGGWGVEARVGLRERHNEEESRACWGVGQALATRPRGDSERVRRVVSARLENRIFASEFYREAFSRFAVRHSPLD
jgi:hypothetical protein